MKKNVILWSIFQLTPKICDKNEIKKNSSAFLFELRNKIYSEFLTNIFIIFLKFL